MIRVSRGKESAEEEDYHPSTSPGEDEEEVGGSTSSYDSQLAAVFGSGGVDSMADEEVRSATPPPLDFPSACDHPCPRHCTSKKKKNGGKVAKPKERKKKTTPSTRRRRNNRKKTTDRTTPPTSPDTVCCDLLPLETVSECARNAATWLARAVEMTIASMATSSAENGH